MSSPITRSKATASGAGASGSPAGGSASPRRYTRGVLKDDKGLLMSPGLPNSSNKRKMSRTVIIEHTGDAPAVFQKKAEDIRQGLVAGVAKIEVEINGQDERAGCFVVREQEGKVFVEMLDMAPNFTRLRNLPVDLSLLEL